MIIDSGDDRVFELVPHWSMSLLVDMAQNSPTFQALPLSMIAKETWLKKERRMTDDRTNGLTERTHHLRDWNAHVLAGIA